MIRNLYLRIYQAIAEINNVANPVIVVTKETLNPIMIIRGEMSANFLYNHTTR